MTEDSNADVAETMTAGEHLFRLPTKAAQASGVAEYRRPKDLVLFETLLMNDGRCATGELHIHEAIHQTVFDDPSLVADEDALMQGGLESRLTRQLVQLFVRIHRIENWTRQYPSREEGCCRSPCMAGG